MKIGIISYTSLHCNFTNYGTVLQSWALSKAIDRVLKSIKDEADEESHEVFLINYCPSAMREMNPLSPFEKMWDTEEEIREQAHRTLPAIKENLKKIEAFYRSKIHLTKREYDANSLDTIFEEEGITCFVVGSDSIWDIQEFGIDKVFFADTELMRNHSIAYAPSFQDSIEKYLKDDWEKAKKMISSNFLSISLRDRHAASILQRQSGAVYPVVLDPTLLLLKEDYQEIECCENIPNSPYILYYSRRYNSQAEAMVEEIAKERNLKVIEISLRAQNTKKHQMRYDAGVEEFISLVKNAELVVTNSFHGVILSIIYRRDFYAYSREHCYSKITELLDSLGLSDRFVSDFNKYEEREIDYVQVYERLSSFRTFSLSYLQNALKRLLK